MATGEPTDPLRATFVAILQQLNRAESIHEGRDHDQALYLDELDRSLRRFWALDEKKVKLPLALGLLVRNRLVQAEVGARPQPHGRSGVGPRYRITAEGKQFLIAALQNAERIA
jgi:hypothetical protein